MSLELNGFGVDRPRGTCAAHRPISARLEPASRLRSVQHWFACAAPSDLARRAPHGPTECLSPPLDTPGASWRTDPARRKPRPPYDLVGLLEISHLALEIHNPLLLSTGDTRPLVVVDLGLQHPAAPQL